MSAARGPSAVAPSSGPSLPQNPSPNPADRADETSGPRGVASHADGGRSSSVHTSEAADAPIPASAPELLDRPTSPEPDAGAQGWQPPLLVGADRVSPLADGALRSMATSAFNTLGPEVNFDWDEFKDRWTDTELAELTRQRAAQRYEKVSRAIEIPSADALRAVRWTIADWDVHPEKRFSQEGRDGSAIEGGKKSGKTRDLQKTELAILARRWWDTGEYTQAEIGEKLGNLRTGYGGKPVSTRTVRNYLQATAGGSDSSFQPGSAPLATSADPHRKRVGNEVSGGPAATGAGGNGLETKSPPPFPAPEIPRWERWPAAQFRQQTGVDLDASMARRLCDLGRCAEAEGSASVDRLMGVIRDTADRAKWDPFAYLERAWHNRGDAWTVDAGLLADVVTWCGDKALNYALQRFTSDASIRPLPYLREALREARESGKPLADAWIQRPVAVAVYAAERLAPGLIVTGVTDAIAQERERERTSHVDSYRRRHGCLPWEAESNRQESEDNYINQINLVIDSSRGSPDGSIPVSPSAQLAAISQPPEPTSPRVVQSGENEVGAGAAITTGTGGNEVRNDGLSSAPAGAADRWTLSLRRHNVTATLGGPDAWLTCGEPAGRWLRPTPASPDVTVADGKIGTEASPDAPRATAAFAPSREPERRPTSGSMSPPMSSPARAAGSPEPARCVRENPLQEAASEPPASGTLTRMVSTPTPVKRAGNEPRAGGPGATGDGGNGAEMTAAPASPSQRNCPSKLAALLASRLDLDAAALSDCPRPGCGCRQYTAGGNPADCPCHLTPHQAAALGRALATSGGVACGRAAAATSPSLS